jgi:hypothetical protein
VPAFAFTGYLFAPENSW